MTDPILLKLRILARAELALFRIHGRRAAAQTTGLVVALVLALLALGMLNLSAYLALAEKLDPAVAALLVAVGDGLLAAIVVALSRRAGPSEDEEKMAQDIRDMAYDELGADVAAVREELAKVSEDLRRIRSGFAALTGSATAGLVSLLSTLSKAVKKER